MSRPPLVSIVLPILDAERFLDEAIKSVLGQTHERWELLLIDDGSTDASGEIARGYASRCPGVRYLEHEGHENRGSSASRNLGLRHATGDFLAFLDADDVYLPQKLERQVVILEGHPEAGMVYGKSLYWHGWTGSPNDDARDRVQPHGIPGETLAHPPGILTSLIAGRAAMPAINSLLVRREVALGVGCFEESFRGMYDDQAFYAKVCAGYPVFISDDCLDWYRQHPDSMCSVVHRSGERLKWRRYFLEWLADYLANRGESDPGLWQALRRETWLAREIPRIGPRFRGRVKWLENWSLRVESLLLPARIRRRLWARRVPALAVQPGPRDSPQRN